MKKFFLILCLFYPINIFAQTPITDTFKVMALNLLHYPTNFVSDNRYIDFGAIAHYTKPDIIIDVELSDNGDDRYADTLLIKGLNTNGVSYYTHANMITPTGDLNNMLFFDSTKFTLYKHFEILTVIRDIDYYVLYYKDSSLACHHDTTFIDIAAAHLKASSGTANANTRATMATDFMNYLNNIPTNRNIILAGDFNFYAPDATEPAYAIITNANNTFAHTFNDIIGSWQRDIASEVSKYTQSTRGIAPPYLGGNGGASGGLDDRFDFIWINNTVANNSNRIAALNSTYTVVGNDSQHYNKSILETPTNTVVPDSIAQNIFNMSDHYPVTLNFTITLPIIPVPVFSPAISAICVNDVITYTINTPIIGQTYTWTVVGGTILSGQGSSSIQVLWNDTTTGSISVQ